MTEDPIEQINFLSSGDLFNYLKKKIEFLPDGTNDICSDPLYTPLDMYLQRIDNCKRHDDVLSLLDVLDQYSMKLNLDEMETTISVASSSYAVVIDRMSHSRKSMRSCTCGTCLIKILLLAAEVCYSVARVHMRFFCLVEGRKALSQSSNLVDFLVDRIHWYYSNGSGMQEESKMSTNGSVDFSDIFLAGTKVKIFASIALANYNLDCNNLAECLQIVDDTFCIIERVKSYDEDFVLMESGLLLARSISLFRLGREGAMSSSKMAVVVLVNAIGSRDRAQSRGARSLFLMLLRSIKNIAALLRDQGDLSSAELFVRLGVERSQSCRLSSPLYEIEHTHLLLVLATIEEQRAPIPLARYRDALQARVDFYGHDHPAVAYVYNLQGLRHMTEGEFALSERCFNRALGIYKAKLNSPTHPNIAKTLLNLGLLQLRRGDLARAFSYQSRSLEMLKSVAIDQVVIANAYMDLADTYIAFGKTGDASDAISRAIAIYEKSLIPQRHPCDLLGLLCGKTHPLLRRARELLKGMK